MDEHNFFTYEPQSFHSFITDDELEKIKIQANKLPLQESSVGGEEVTKQPAIHARRSQVKWIPKDNEHKWIYDKLLNLANNVNKEKWKFKLNDFEQIQYTIYNNKQYGSYDWHIDTMARTENGLDVVRKISIVCPITNLDEYKGGKFMINFNGAPQIFEQSPGTVHIFPSWMPHTITPIFQGIRHSLVLWISGPRFK